MSASDMFKRFLADDSAWDMYVYGAAGTGKTTLCKEFIQHCSAIGYPVIVCAYTHKAKGILRDKLPQGTEITTLHSFLKKAPTVNHNATSKTHLVTAKQMSTPEKIKLLVVDEFSMIGEKDYADLRALQDEDYDGKAEVKILWLGDPYQLPPVQDMQAVVPSGPYKFRLTVQKRRGKDNPLSGPIASVVSFIEGAEPQALPGNEAFIRGVDIAKAYAEDPEQDKVILCYTNKAVQDNNERAEGKVFPVAGDVLFSPSNQHRYTLIQQVSRNEVQEIKLAFGEPLQLGSKYKTLEYLLKNPHVSFGLFEDEDDDEVVLAYIFGHYSYKQLRDSYTREAAEANLKIEKEIKGVKASAWAKSRDNEKHPLARARSKAWRDFLTFDECVFCLDFCHAMTVHKSQGSTYKHVYVDTQDLSQLANTNFSMYLRLMYVALSRASAKVVTN